MCAEMARSSAMTVGVENAHWFDSHCHLDLPPLASTIPRVVQNARRAGVVAMIVPGVRGQPGVPAIDSTVLMAWGYHPLAAGTVAPEILEEEFAALPIRPVAVGECGLDRHLDTPLAIQSTLFVVQLQIARRHGLPLIIHLRGHWSVALDLLRLHAPDVPWIMHAFGGSREVAQLFVRHGAFVSIAGPVCSPRAVRLHEMIRALPAERILLETDAPDLKPVGWPALVNGPEAVPFIGAAVARLRDCGIGELAAQVWANGTRVFPILAAGR